MTAQLQAAIDERERAPPSLVQQTRALLAQAPASGLLAPSVAQHGEELLRQLAQEDLEAGLTAGLRLLHDVVSVAALHLTRSS